MKKITVREAVGAGLVIASAFMFPATFASVVGILVFTLGTYLVVEGGR